MRCLSLTALLALSACGPFNEIDNPHPFRILAERHGPNGETVFEDIDARLRCTSWDCGERFDGERDCACDGSYELIGSAGLDFKFHGTAAASPGRVSTEDGTLRVLLNGVSGSGAVVLSRAERQALDARNYTFDIAGGFAVQIGPERFVRGVIYAPQGAF